MAGDQQVSTRRASCDQCRQRKLKCDGGYPECERCVATKQLCSYSAKLPMGRPKRRKLNDREAATNIPSGEGCVESAPEKGSVMEERALDGCLHDAPRKGSVTTLECTNETNVNPTLLALKPTSDSHAASCACLATLYLSLEEIRTVDELSFSRRLSRLQQLTDKSAAIIQCNVCPTKFIWAMQNAQLLNTLILSIAEEFRKLVVLVDEEAPSETKDKRRVIIIDDGQIDKCESEGQEIDGFSVTINASEWGSLAKRATKCAIFGPSSTDSTTFMDMLQTMENRQHLWHSGHMPLPQGIGTRMAHQKGEDPHCVSLVKHTRGLMMELNL